MEFLILGAADRVLPTQMMNRRAHYQTFVVVFILQFLAMLMPVAWWIYHKHPPTLSVWVG